MQRASSQLVHHRLQQRPIVCLVDQTTGGLAAARAAATVARAADALLILVHVARRAEPPGAMPTALRQLPVADVEVQTRTGPPSACLRMATRENAALIVIGGGRGALRATVTGSMTDQLVSTSPCPVMVVPPQWAESGRAGLAGDGVVCGVEDWGDVGPARVAQRLADVLSVPLTLVHVLPASPNLLAGHSRCGMPFALAAEEEARRDDAERQLRRLAGRLTGSEAPKLVVVAGGSAVELRRLAVDTQAGAVVVGSRRWRGPLVASFLGSVSRDLARTSPVPVVVCPAQ